MLGRVVSLQSDLRDHREGMEETRLGEEKRGDACDASHWVPEGDLCLHPLLTFMEQLQMWAAQGRSLTLDKVPLSLTDISRKLLQLNIVGSTLKIYGSNSLHSHRMSSITYRSYCYSTEAKKEEITPEIQQRNQGNLRGWQNRRWRITVGYWILCLSTPDTNKYFLKEQLPLFVYNQEIIQVYVTQQIEH